LGDDFFFAGVFRRALGVLLFTQPGYKLDRLGAPAYADNLAHVLELFKIAPDGHAGHTGKDIAKRFQLCLAVLFYMF
jgi:hypothetical protein